MGYEYDRFEREDGGGSFLMGLLAGTVLGAGLGMLFAPKPGSDLRNQLTEQAGKIKSTANETYQQASGKVSQIVDRGREAYDRARGTAANAAAGATEAASDLAASARQAGQDASRSGNLSSMPGTGTSSNRF